MSWYQDFLFRKTLTIDSSKVNSSLSTFNVLVKLDNINFDFTKVKSDGYDIVFVNEGNLCDFEVVEFDSVNETAEYWIKIPTISHTADTIFYIYYGKTDQLTSLESSTSIWNLNYNAVYHMNDYDNSGTIVIKDSTANNNHGTKVSSTNPLQVTGKIGKSQRFNGTNSDVRHPGPLFVNDQDFTIEIWGDVGASPKVHECICGNGLSTGANLYFYSTTYGSAVNQVRVYAHTSEKVIGSDIRNTGWTYLALVKEGTNWKLYENDIFIDEFVGSSDNIGTDFAFGSQPAVADRFFTGDIDEVRVSSIAGGSTEWLKTEYHSQNNTLITFGSEEDDSATILTFIADYDIGEGLKSDYESVYSLNVITYSDHYILYSISSGQVITDYLSKNSFPLFHNFESNLDIKREIKREMEINYSLFIDTIKDISIVYNLDAIKKIRKNEQAIYNLTHQQVIILKPVFKLQV